MLCIEGEKPIQAIHMEIDTFNFKKNFRNIIDIYGHTQSGFNDRRKTRFFPYPELVKSDIARRMLTKVYNAKNSS